MLTQKKIVQILAPLLAPSPIFEKFKPVLARPAQPKTFVETFTNDGKETENRASEGDFVVQNDTKAKEQYIVSRDKFLARYVKIPSDDNSGEWTKYKPTGKCRAIVADEELLKVLQQKSGFHFEASWGSEMICKEGDMLVTNDIEGEITQVYRIGKQEFSETYRPYLPDK